MQTIGLDHGTRQVTGVLVDRAAVAGPSAAQVVATASSPVGAGAVAAVVADLVARSDGERLSHAVLATDMVAELLADHRLRPVGAIRLCDPPRSVMPPYHGWPSALADLLGAPGWLTGVTPAELDRTASQVVDRGVQSVAITGAFSGVSVAEERRASAVVRERIPGVRVTLSHSLGPIGLLERENAAILNAATVAEATVVLAAWSEALTGGGGTDLPLHLVRHDGTTADSDYLQEHPLLTLGGRRAALARGCAVAAGTAQALVGWPAADEWGMEVVAVQDHLPQRSDRPRVVLGVPTSVPQPDVRRAATVHRWDRIAGDDHVQVREAAATAGVDGPLIMVAAGSARVVSGGAAVTTTGGPRPALAHDDAGVLTALGAATGEVGGECERLVGPGAPEDSSATEVESEARVRAVAAGARFDATRVLARSRARVSYTTTERGGQWHRVGVRVVGEPIGRTRGEPTWS